MSRTTAFLRARLAHVVLLAIVGGYFVVLWAVGGRYHWDVLGIPVLPFPYGDLRSVTSAWECTRKGIAVMASNSCDPLNRPANYPGVWMAPSHLGLGVGDTVWLGRVIAVTFLVGAFAVLPSRARVFDGVLYGAALCSPAVMLGVERGNVDILLFALVVLAASLYRRFGSAPVAQALVLFAAVLKLFPIFAAGLFLRDRSRRSLTLLGAMLALFAVYCIAIFHELRVIWRVTPRPSEYAYGIRICSEWIVSWAGNTSLSALDLLIAFAVAVALIGARRRLRGWLPTATGASAQRDVDLFIAGAGIYVLSYVLFRSYEYRLVYLLLTLPQLLRWLRAGRVLGQFSLLALLAVLWLDFRPKHNVFGFHTPLAVVALEQVFLFALLAAGLIATLIPATHSNGKRGTVPT